MMMIETYTNTNMQVEPTHAIQTQAVLTQDVELSPKNFPIISLKNLHYQILFFMIFHKKREV